MSHLLQILPFKPVPNPQVGTLEVEVSPETYPYLVTSSKGLTWVSEPKKIVRAAFRQNCKFDQLYQEVLEAVSLAGVEFGWGNIQPLNSEGLQEAISHVDSYGQGNLELLVPISRGDGLKELCSTHGLPLRPCSWIQGECVVVTPKDRGFVGMAGKVGKDVIVGVVHNPARGIGIARN